MDLQVGTKQCFNVQMAVIVVTGTGPSIAALNPAQSPSVLHLAALLGRLLRQVKHLPRQAFRQQCYHPSTRRDHRLQWITAHNPQVSVAVTQTLANPQP